MKNIQDKENIIVIETTENGRNKIEALPIGSLKYKDKTYLALSEIKNTEMIHIYEYVDIDSKKYLLKEIVENDIFEGVVNVFKNTLETEFLKKS